MTYIPDVWSDRRVQGGIGGAILAGLGAGMVIGYTLAKRKYRAKLTTFDVFNEVKTNDLNQLSIDFRQTEEGAGYSVVIPNDPDEAVVLVPSEDISMENAAEAELIQLTVVDDLDWDWEAELAARNPLEPYVIHVEEFKENEHNFRQETLTFYAGDEIMSQEPTDTPVYGYLNLMGELKFGHGSKDPSVVYIRNEKLGMEWEILRHHGHYSIEVEGHTMDQDVDEIQHSHHRIYKFRGD